MAKKREKVNFRLCELTHLSGELFHSSTLWPTMRDMIEERIKFGKKIILSKTEPGDLVMMESPERHTYEDSLKGQGKKDSSRLREEWEGIEKSHSNMYYELAKFARSRGRRVLSLEPSPADSGGKLAVLANRLREASPENFKRTEYLVGARRDDVYVRKITWESQAEARAGRTPLAIAACSHVIGVRSLISPMETIWNNRPAAEAVRETLALRREAKKFISRFKKKRRARNAKTTKGVKSKVGKKTNPRKRPR